MRCLRLCIPLCLVVAPSAVLAQRGAAEDPTARLGGRSAGGAIPYLAGLARSTPGVSLAGNAAMFSPLNPGAADSPLLRLSDVPEAATNPDAQAARALGTPDTLQDSAMSVTLYHHSVIADRHLIGGNPLAALEHLDSGLVLDPLNLALLERAARAAAIAGQPRRSRLYWEVLANLSVRDAEIQAERILALCREGRVYEAQLQVVAARETFPQNVGFRLWAAALDPARAGSHLGLLNLRDIARLSRDLHQRRDSLPFLVGADYARLCGQVLAGGDAPTGEAPADADDSYWARTAALASRYLFAAEAAFQSGGYAALLESLDGAAKVGVSGAWLHLRRAQGLHALGRSDEALVEAVKLLAREEEEREFLLATGWMLLDLARPVEAGVRFSRILRADRSDPEARFALACSLGASGQIAASLVQVRNLREEVPRRMAEWLASERPAVRELRGRLE
jgi:hypothetical protein